MYSAYNKAYNNNNEDAKRAKGREDAQPDISFGTKDQIFRRGHAVSVQDLLPHSRTRVRRIQSYQPIILTGRPAVKFGRPFSKSVAQHGDAVRVRATSLIR
jgi:hypothetical protein